MLQAARQSLFEGRYSEAIAAYQAVLKRDERNVDAMTHLGLIVAVRLTARGARIVRGRYPKRKRARKVFGA